MLSLYSRTQEMLAIEVSNLYKSFGAVKAIDDVSFKVETGEVFGFLGPNGAGKTTTIRCLMDFIRPDKGEISILGLNLKQNGVRTKNAIGYVPADSELYEDWTGQDHINFVQKARRRPLNESIELIRKLDLNPRLAVKHLSTGNKQKLALILALMSNPKLLILDEPTQGLDPILQNEVYGLLKEFKNKGGSIFISSHNLHEVEHICDRVGIIKLGQLIKKESLESIRRKNVHLVNVSFENQIDAKNFELPDVEIVSRYNSRFNFKVRGDLNLLMNKICQQRFLDLEITHANLEEVFLEFYK